MVAEKFVDLQKAVGPEITRVDLVPAFQVDEHDYYYYVLGRNTSEIVLKLQANVIKRYQYM